MVLNINLDTLAFKVHNRSIDIQQMSGEMIDYKSKGMSKSCNDRESNEFKISASSEMDVPTKSNKSLGSRDL